MKRKLLWLGDIHTGNIGAIQPEEFWSKEEDGGKAKAYPANEIQKKMFSKWQQMSDEHKKPDILILNGDLVDGLNYKSGGLGLWTPDIDLQILAFKELVDMIKPRQIIGTSGSPYHSKSNPNHDKMAIEKVGGLYKGGYASLNPGEMGVRFFFQHKTSVSKSTWQYRTTPLARALVLAALNEPEYGHYNFVGKNHVHYFVYAGFTNSCSITGPCWKAFDEFGDHNIEFPNPAIGFVHFEIVDGEADWNYDVMHFKQSEINADVI